MQTLEGHEDRVRSVAWNPSGTRLVSGSQDGTLRIWDTATRKCVQTLEGHEGWVNSVAWNPSGTRIVSGSDDRTLRIWESRVDEALPVWRAADLRGQIRDWVDGLYDEELLLEPVLAAVEGDRERSGELREAARRYAIGRQPTTKEIERATWRLVNPAREGRERDADRALRLSRAAIERAPTSAVTRMSLAYALFANGLLDEALAEATRALELDALDPKRADRMPQYDFEVVHAQLLDMIEEARK